MEIVIVSTSNVFQEEYWQNHLKDLKPSAHIICVTEDWAGGAGNGLGTLYAYAKACQKGKLLFNLDVDKCLANGASVALYHTAGKGKRLYPLTGSEFGNKSAVKLPGFIQGTQQLMSILEGVIQQTAALAPYRQGRLSVFWGDQIFIPSSPYETPQCPIEIFIQSTPFPSVDEWYKKGYDHYGFVVLQKGRLAYIFEKMDQTQFANFVSKGILDHNAVFGLSLGSFSLSYRMLNTLLQLFKTELEVKNVSMDTDVHFWMPLLLEENNYLDYMVHKQFSRSWATKHYHRLQSLKHRLPENLIGTWDIGSQSPWWDYGNIGVYYANNLKLLQKNSAGDNLRSFFGWPTLDANGSLLFNTQIGSGSVENSILINVEAQELNVTDSIIINTKIDKLTAAHSLLYQVVETDHLSMKRQIRADVKLKTSPLLKFYTRLDEDGKKQWSECLPDNEVSYQVLSQMIQENNSLV